MKSSYRNPLFMLNIVAPNGCEDFALLRSDGVGELLKADFFHESSRLCALIISGKVPTVCVVSQRV